MNTAKVIYEGINNDLKEELPVLFDRSDSIYLFCQNEYEDYSVLHIIEIFTEFATIYLFLNITCQCLSPLVVLDAT